MTAANTLQKAKAPRGGRGTWQKSRESVLTFTDRSPVHYPDQGGAIFTVGGDAVLGRLENVAVVLFHLPGERLGGEHKEMAAQSAAKRGDGHGQLPSSELGFAFIC